MSITNAPIILLLGLFGVVVAVIAIVYLAAPVFQGIAWVLTNIGRGIAWFFSHIFRFIFGMAGDFVRGIGGVITSIVLVPIIIGNVLIGRWSAAGHFGRTFQDEVAGIGHCIYRVLIGHPAKFLLLGGLVEGIEQRIPQAVAQSPGADKPSRRTGEFEGYKIVGSLQGGGSGGRLYVAEPDERKRAAFARGGRDVKQVVIKVFSLSDGSSLPQIIRESRALEAAKKMGLILDHELTDARFYYVMEFIPGDSLTVVTKRLHAEAGPQGLASRQLMPALGMIGDLLTELDRYHRGGLWHKDVKPDNIIINQGRAHLVDLGLVTPLRSAMTLTTHGTEYFRDPELVRMALRGAKVNEVDGVKFDLYGVGAVLYSVVENSFPAHGGLSQITRACPEALRWVVRRAMTDLHNRYATAGEMLADLRAVMAATDAFMLKPADLPSVVGGAAMPPPLPQEEEFVAVRAAAASPVPTPPAEEKRGFIFEANIGVGGGEAKQGARRAPRLRVTDWWTGRYAGAAGDAPANAGFDASRLRQDAERMARNAAAAAVAGVHEAARVIRNGGAPPAAPTPGPGRTAAEQLASARERVRRAQERVRGRLTGGAFATSFSRSGRFSTRPNPGVAGAFFLFLTVAVAVPMALVVISLNRKEDRQHAQVEAQAHSNSIEVATDFGRLTVSSDDGSLITLDTDAPSSDHASVNIDTSDGVSELNEVGRKVSAFFDELRRKKAEADTSASVAPPAPGLPAPENLPPPAAPGSAGTLLVLNLLPTDTIAEEGPRLATLADRLVHAGFLVRGVSASADDTEALAAGRRVAELSPPDDPDAAARVRAWLNDPATALDAVLWIAPGREPGAVLRRLITRDGFDGRTIAAALAAR